MIKDRNDAQEIADLIVGATTDYTHLYMTSILGREGIMSRQLWASLHCGMIVALENTGFRKKILYNALDLAQKKLEEIYGPGLDIKK